MLNLLREIAGANGWSVANVQGFVFRTDAERFGINDPASHRTGGASVLVESAVGTASFENKGRRNIQVGHYGALVQSQPVQQPKNCDFILFAEDVSHFLLVELKEYSGNRGRRKYPVEQLRSGLRYVWPTAQARFGGSPHKRCCLFRCLPQMIGSGVPASAVRAFNAPNRVAAPNGMRRSDPVITAEGFEYWVFTDHQPCRMT